MSRFGVAGDVVHDFDLSRLIAKREEIQWKNRWAYCGRAKPQVSSKGRYDRAGGCND